MKIKLLIGMALACSMTQAIAQTGSTVTLKSLSTRESEECARNLRVIYEAIQSYRNANKDLPSWLSDLVPRHLADSSAFICPVTARTGSTSTYGLVDPEIRTSYAYEFSVQQIPEERWGGSTLSMKQHKKLQMAVVGSDTPILRCYNHTPRLNVGFNGRLYESDQVWEKNFESIVSVKDLSPRQLLKRFDIPHEANQSLPPGALEYVGAISNPKLQSVVGVAVSPDGRFVYAVGFNAASVQTFSRDMESGLLTSVQTITDTEVLGAAVRIKLSPDGRHAVVSSFSSDSVTLFERNSDTGHLRLLDFAMEGRNGVHGLDFVIAADFCPGTHFLYCLGSSSGAVTALQYSEDGKLEFIQANVGEGGCFDNARGLAFDPSGKYLYVASADADTLAVLERDSNSGHTKLIQLLKDEEDGIHGLAGAFQVTLSPDGRFAYVSSGRFSGDSSIGIYQVNPDHTLTLVKELMDEEDDLVGFEGGNELILSPDGNFLYVVASRSHTLLSFARSPKSGLLTRLQTIRHDAYGAGAKLMGAANLAISPDGKHVYVGAELNDAVSVFRRSNASLPALQ